jgi:hypothetical protein
VKRNPANFWVPSDAVAVPPAVVVAMVTPGLVPPVREAVAVREATLSPSRVPPKVSVYGPPALPVTTTSPGARLDRASRAAWTVAAVAL